MSSKNSSVFRNLTEQHIRERENKAIETKASPHHEITFTLLKQFTSNSHYAPCFPSLSELKMVVLPLSYEIKTIIELHHLR